MGNMFDLDDNLLKEDKKETKDYSELLKKANIFCMRELFDKALAIYNEILEEDMENEEAYIGLLKVHSAYFTKYDGDEIEKDIRIIERMFPDTVNEEYAKYCLERKKALASKKPEPKPEPKVEVKEEKKEETKKVVEPKKEEKKPVSSFVFNADIQKGMHNIDHGSWKKALEVSSSLLNSHTEELYSLYIYGMANYGKERYNDMKKYLELFLSKIDKNNPFYGRTVFHLGYAYSGLNGRAPDYDKAVYYFSLSEEVMKHPLTRSYIALMQECKNGRELTKYMFAVGSSHFQNGQWIYTENLNYAKSLINKGDVRGYAIYSKFANTLPLQTRVDYMRKYLNSRLIDKYSYFYAVMWFVYYFNLIKKAEPLPQNVRDVMNSDRNIYHKTTNESVYLSLKKEK